MTGRVEMTWNKSTKTYDPFVCKTVQLNKSVVDMLVPSMPCFRLACQRCGTWLPNTCFFRWILWRWEDVGVERLEVVFNTHMNFEYDVIPNILAFWSLKQTYCDRPIQEPMGSHTNWWLRTGGQCPVHQSCVTWTYAPAFLCLVASEVFVRLEKEDVKTEDLFFLSTARIVFSD